MGPWAGPGSGLDGGRRIKFSAGVKGRFPATAKVKSASKSGGRAPGWRGARHYRPRAPRAIKKIIFYRVGQRKRECFRYRSPFQIQSSDAAAREPFCEPEGGSAFPIQTPNPQHGGARVFALGGAKGTKRGQGGAQRRKAQATDARRTAT